MPEIPDKLKEVTEVLISPVIDYTAILNATKYLKALFYEATGFNDYEPANLQNIITGTGLAISPVSAAFCITDMMRTRIFLLGIRQAIEERLKKAPGKPVIVLYAGTGPFGTLLTPLLTLFSPEQLQIILLEINPGSIAYLQKAISHFRMGPYIIDLLHADASTFFISPKHQPDILVSETMKPALEKEPQVSITANLISQCNKSPVLIPECIRVEAALIGNIAKPGFTILPLKLLMELTAETAAIIQNNPQSLPAFSKGIEVEITMPADPSCTQLVLLTHIKVFGQHILQFNECGLTIPHRLLDLGISNEWPRKFLFKYHAGTVPGFVCTAIQV